MSLDAFSELECDTMRLQLGLCPGPCWGAYSALPEPLAGLQGKGRTEEEKGNDLKDGEGKGNGVAPPQTTALDPPVTVYTM